MSDRKQGDTLSSRKKKVKATSRTNYYCEYCKQQVSNKESFDKHNETTFHLETRKKLLDAIRKQTNFCYTCDKIFDKKLELDSHCLLLRHQQLYRMMTIVKSFEEGEKGSLVKVSTASPVDKSLAASKSSADDKPSSTEKPPVADKSSVARKVGVSMNSDALYYCKTCDLDCITKVEFLKHIDSWKHRAKLDNLRDSGGTSQSDKTSMDAEEEKKKPLPSQLHDKTKFYCDICNLPCPGEMGYKDHLNGKKHHRTVSQMKAPFRCYVCDKKYNTERDFKDHLSSQGHIEVAFKSTKTPAKPGKNQKNELAARQSRSGSGSRSNREKGVESRKTTGRSRSKSRERSGSKDINRRTRRSTSKERRTDRKKHHSRSRSRSRSPGKYKREGRSRESDADRVREKLKARKREEKEDVRESSKERTGRKRHLEDSSSRDDYESSGKKKEASSEKDRKVALVDQVHLDHDVKDLREKIGSHDLRDKIGKGKSNMVITKIVTEIGEASDDTSSVPVSRQMDLTSVLKQSGSSLPSEDDRYDDDKGDLREQLDQKAFKTVEEDSMSRREQLLDDRERELLKYHDLEEEYKKFRLEEDYLKRRLELRDTSEDDRKADIQDLKKVEYILEDIRRELETQELLIRQKEREILFERDRWHKMVQDKKEQVPSEVYKDSKDVKIFVETREKAIDGQPLPCPESSWSAPIVEKVKEEKIVFEYGNKSMPDGTILSGVGMSKGNVGIKSPGRDAIFDDVIIQSYQGQSEGFSSREDAFIDKVNAGEDKDLRHELEKERLLKKLQPELELVDPALRERIVHAILAKETASEIKRQDMNSTLDKDYEDVSASESLLNQCESEGYDNIYGEFDQQKKLVDRKPYHDYYETSDAAAEELMREALYNRGYEDQYSLDHEKPEEKWHHDVQGDMRGFKEVKEDFIVQGKSNQTYGSSDLHRRSSTEGTGHEKTKSSRSRASDRKEKHRDRGRRSSDSRHRRKRKDSGKRRGRGRSRSRSRERSSSNSSRSSSGSKSNAKERSKEKDYLKTLTPVSFASHDAMLYHERFMALVGKDNKLSGGSGHPQVAQRAQGIGDEILDRMTPVSTSTMYPVPSSYAGNNNTTTVPSQMPPYPGSNWPASFAQQPRPLKPDGVALVPPIPSVPPVARMQAVQPMQGVVSYPRMPTLPGSNTLPFMPGMPPMPNMPGMQGVPTIPNMQAPLQVNRGPNAQQLNTAPMMQRLPIAPNQQIPPNRPNIALDLAASRLPGSPYLRNMPMLPMSNAANTSYTTISTPSSLNVPSMMQFSGFSGPVPPASAAVTITNTVTMHSLYAGNDATGNYSNLKELTSTGQQPPSSKSDSRSDTSLDDSQAQAIKKRQEEFLKDMSLRGSSHSLEDQPMRPRETFSHWKSKLPQEVQKLDIWEVALETSEDSVMEAASTLKENTDSYMEGDTDRYLPPWKASTDIENLFARGSNKSIEHETSLSRSSHSSVSKPESSTWKEIPTRTRTAPTTKPFATKSILKQPTKKFKEQPEKMQVEEAESYSRTRNVGIVKREEKEEEEKEEENRRSKYHQDREHFDVDERITRDKQVARTRSDFEVERKVEKDRDRVEWEKPLEAIPLIDEKSNKGSHDDDQSSLRWERSWPHHSLDQGGDLSAPGSDSMFKRECYGFEAKHKDVSYRERKYGEDDLQHAERDASLIHRRHFAERGRGYDNEEYNQQGSWDGKVSINEGDEEQSAVRRNAGKGELLETSSRHGFQSGESYLSRYANRARELDRRETSAPYRQDSNLRQGEMWTDQRLGRDLRERDPLAREQLLPIGSSRIGERSYDIFREKEKSPASKAGYDHEELSKRPLKYEDEDRYMTRRGGHLTSRDIHEDTTQKGHSSDFSGAHDSRASEMDRNRRVYERGPRSSYTESAIRREREEASSGGESNSKSSMACDVCNLSFSTPGSYKIHLITEQHRKAVGGKGGGHDADRDGLMEKLKENTKSERLPLNHNRDRLFPSTAGKEVQRAYGSPSQHKHDSRFSEATADLSKRQSSYIQQSQRGGEGEIADSRRLQYTGRQGAKRYETEGHLEGRQGFNSSHAESEDKNSRPSANFWSSGRSQGQSGRTPEQRSDQRSNQIRARGENRRQRSAFMKDI